MHTRKLRHILMKGCRMLAFHPMQPSWTQAKHVFEGANAVTQTALGHVERLAQQVTGEPCLWVALQGARKGMQALQKRSGGPS